MLLRADLGIRLIPKGSKNQTNLKRTADFVIENFNQLDCLVFHHGYSSYVKIATLVCYYFYKNMILVFAEVWFSIYCGFTGERYFLSLLIAMYNILLTTLQCFVGLYYEKSSASSQSSLDDAEHQLYF